MINLFQYEDYEIVKIIDTDDNEYVGKVSDVDGVEDQTDLFKQEQAISIITEDKGYIYFYQSDIKSIEIIK